MSCPASADSMLYDPIFIFDDKKEVSIVVCMKRNFDVIEIFNLGEGERRSFDPLASRAVKFTEWKCLFHSYPRINAIKSY